MLLLLSLSFCTILFLFSSSLFLVFPLPCVCVLILCFSNSTSAVWVTLCFIYGLWSLLYTAFICWLPCVCPYPFARNLSVCTYYFLFYFSYFFFSSVYGNPYIGIEGEMEEKVWVSVCVCAHILVCVSCSELKLQMLISILVCTHISVYTQQHTPHVSVLNHLLSLSPSLCFTFSYVFFLGSGIDRE